MRAGIVVTRRKRKYADGVDNLREGGRCAGGAGCAAGNQDLHFSAEIGFAIKRFGIKFSSAGATDSYVF